MVTPRPPQTRAELKKLIDWLKDPGNMKVWMQRLGIKVDQGDHQDGSR